ncbi:MAG: hypothetical protein PHW82_17560 [Bacteroidales bacterium]|nr:hypothetical protein [Bacteroidales bacterium]
MPPEPWTNDWTILTTCGEGGRPSQDFDKTWSPEEMIPGKYSNRPYYDASDRHLGIMELHPISDKEPAMLRFTGTIPLDRPILVVVAGGNLNGDCVLKCVVNDLPIGEYTLDGSKWTTCTFDLSQYLGKPTTVELWNCAGGKDPWHFEHCYIDQIGFQDK